MPVGARCRSRYSTPFCFSKAAWYSSCIDALHQSVILSIHSLYGRPLLLVPSNLPNTTDLIFLSFSILHICPKSSSFLVIIFCIRFSVSSILLYNSAFVTFCIQPILAKKQLHNSQNGFMGKSSCRPIAALMTYSIREQIVW